MPSKAIVTGASGGLGREFAQLLAQAGYDVVLAARSLDKLHALAAQIGEKFGVDARPVELDLAKDGSAAALFAQVPRCDVLVNNAGFANNGTFAQIDPALVDEELELDVVTLTRLCRLYLPQMMARGDGRILNVASTAGFLPGPNMAVYYAAKAYVISFSEALWEETRKTGASVTVLCPGATKTQFAERAKMQTAALFRASAADAASVAKAGIEGMMRGKRMVIPGFMNKLTAFCPRISPRATLLRVSGALVKRR
ncbi:MAG: SDR family NAD(P)-dependent oxidoreductase [Candidatus Baltobacteraceae bacterium]